MSNYDNAVSMIESRLKLIEAGETSAVVHAEASMAIEMAHSCGVILAGEYVAFVRRQNAAYDEQSKPDFVLSRLMAEISEMTRTSDYQDK